MRSISGLLAVLLLAGGIGSALGMANDDALAAGKAAPALDRSQAAEQKLDHATRAAPGKDETRHEQALADLREKMILHTLML